MNKNRVQSIIISVVCILIAAFFFFAGFFTNKINNMLKSGYSVEFNSEEIDPDLIINFMRTKKMLLDNYYQPIDENTLLQGAIKGMAEATEDKYTVYYTPEEMQQFRSLNMGGDVGIGVTVYMDENNVLTVMETYPDSPAKAAGLKPGDRIVKVYDEDVTQITDEDIIIRKIKGEENTAVELTIFRPDPGEYVTLELERKFIKMVYVNSKVLDNKIGYIQIKMFDEDIYTEFTEHLNELLSSGIKGVVLDLRNNPGGDYDEVMKIADSFIPEGVIIYTEDKNGKVINTEYSDSNHFELPLVVLVNGRSASASEVLTASIKDYNIGTIVGTKTFGKGIVQETHLLNQGAGLKLTVSKYFTSKGVCIQGEGIEPNIEITNDKEYEYYNIEDIPEGKDLQLNKAIDIILDKISGK